jgi:hypothetical protein
MPYNKDSVVLIDLKGICFIGIYLIDIRFIGGTAQKVDINKLDNRRVGHLDSFNINIKCRVIG